MEPTTMTNLPVKHMQRDVDPKVMDDEVVHLLHQRYVVR
jgi:hypothetical protein